MGFQQRSGEVCTEISFQEVFELSAGCVKNARRRTVPKRDNGRTLEEAAVAKAYSFLL